MNEREPRPPDADALAKLIQAAGRREEPPERAYAQTLDVATAAWHAKIRRRQRRVTAWLAASVAVATAGTWFVVTSQVGTAQPIARVERIIGSVDVRTGNTGGWATLRDESQSIVAGTLLRTHEGSRLGVLLADAVSLRLAEDTQVSVESASRIHLRSGKVYVDTGVRGNARVQVVTDAGVASDVGTQFEIQYRQQVYRLRVREGAVQLQRGATNLRSAAGEQLSIDVNGAITRTPVAASDTGWQWTQGLTSAPDIDNQPLTVLLDWVARETGRAIRFSNAETERRARRTILHGNIQLLAPLDALSVMLATTDLEYVLLDDGTIMIQ